MNDRLYIKIKENIDKYQSLYLIRNVTKKIIPDNYVESFEKFGFNLVSNLNMIYILWDIFALQGSCAFFVVVGTAHLGQRNIDEQPRNRDGLSAQVSRANEEFIR